MIISFACKETELIWNGYASKRFPSAIQQTARRKLVHVNSALNLMDLRVPPGNKLEALRKDLKGKHSFRINDQWRVVFRWKEGNAYDVEIKDYH